MDHARLQKCISSESTPRDLSAIFVVSGILMAYNEGFLKKIAWIKGIDNASDVFTKILAGETAGILDELLVQRRLTVKYR